MSCYEWVGGYYNVSSEKGYLLQTLEKRDSYKRERLFLMISGSDLNKSVPKTRLQGQNVWGQYLSF